MVLNFIYNSNIHNNFLIEILPTILIFGLAVLRLKPSAIAVYNGVISINYGKDIIKKISDILEKSNNESALITENFKFDNSINFYNVIFKYENKDILIFKNVNFTIKKSTTVGIIGQSGSGKSTLINLLMGLIEPTSGHIKIDNEIINRSNIISLQSKIGYVPQSIFLFDDTIFKNVAFGIKDSDIDLDKVIECCKMVYLHNFILESLPFGYETKIGERGSQLSGGQQQRLGIARALYRNPEIIILDESTSALDLDTENYIVKSLNSLSKSKTLIIVTHRINSGIKFDEIIHIENGSIKQNN
jgi:ABC-type multidrug transport system fused ATPase/permease subunit